MFPNGPPGSLVPMALRWRVLRLDAVAQLLAAHSTVRPGGGPGKPPDATTRAVDGPGS